MLLTCILLFFLASLTFASLTHVFYWYERVNDPAWEELEADERRRLFVLMLRNVGISLLCHLVVGVTYLFGLFPGRKAAPPREGDDGKPAVLFIHGLYHNRAAWPAYLRWFRDAGFDRLETVTYDTMRHDVDDCLDLVAERVREMAEVHGPVALVGHSLGGLLTRCCLSRPDLDGCIHSVVTLAAPHQGSTLAALAWGRAGRSLLYRGPLIRRIEGRETPPKVPALSCFTTLDNMVLPLAGGRLDVPGWTELHVGHVSHLAFLYHRPSARAAMAFIASRGETVSFST